MSQKLKVKNVRIVDTQIVDGIKHVTVEAEVVMTLRQAIQQAAWKSTKLTLSPADVVRVNAALGWGERILESINAEKGETEGGNSETSGLDEEYEGVEMPGVIEVDFDALEDASGHMEYLAGLLSKQSKIIVHYRKGV